MYFGRIFGAKLKLSTWFLLFMLSIAASGFLPEATIVFMVLLAHEMGHVMVARRCGLTVEEVELMPFGGVARLQELVGTDPDVEAKVAMAGPAVNLLFIALILTLNTFFPLEKRLLRALLQVNMLLVLFNLLPALPLDGGRLYRAYLTQKIGFQRATAKAARGGAVLGIVLCLIALAGFLLGYYNWNLLILALFLLYVVRRERQHAIYTFMQYLATKQSELRRKRALAVENVAVDSSARVKDLFSFFVPHKYHMFMLIDERGKPGGVVTEHQVLDAIMKHGIDASIKDIMSQR